MGIHCLIGEINETMSYGVREICVYKVKKFSGEKLV